jgi:hypothetical protein
MRDTHPVIIDVSLAADESCAVLSIDGVLIGRVSKDREGQTLKKLFDTLGLVVTAVTCDNHPYAPALLERKALAIAPTGCPTRTLDGGHYIFAVQYWRRLGEEVEKFDHKSVKKVAHRSLIAFGVCLIDGKPITGAWVTRPLLNKKRTT